MAALLLEVAVRAALIAVGTACILWALRIRAAAARHAAWTTVVIAMLLLPIWSVAGPKIPLAVLPATPASLDSGSGANPGLGNVAPQPSVARSGPMSIPATAPTVGASVLIGAYLLGAFALLIRLAIGTAHARRLRRGAVMHAGRATSARCATPITVGWLAPVLILPEGWDRWSASHLDAVLTHELEHARRHDPLVQWLALLNRAIFWFHPLAWWLERRLANLAEEACDAAVIRAGHAPQDYSEYLIDMARALTRQGRRLNVVGLAMPGSNLQERMRHIFEEGLMKPLPRIRVICTLALCTAASVVCAAAILAPRPSTAVHSPATADAHPGNVTPAAPVNQKPMVAQATVPGTVVPARANSPSRSASKTDFSGHWSLVSATSRGTRGGNGGGGWTANDAEVNVTAKWASGAPVNCGPECTLVQDAKTLTISRLGTPNAVTIYDTGEVVLNLDGSDSPVNQSSRTQYIVHANWEGGKLVVTYHTPWQFTVTQVLSVEDGKLKVVTDFGVGYSPVTLTYVKG